MKLKIEYDDMNDTFVMTYQEGEGDMEQRFVINRDDVSALTNCLRAAEDSANYSPKSFTMTIESDLSWDENEDEDEGS